MRSTFHYQRRLALEGGGVATNRPTPFYCHYFGHPYYLLELVCALARPPPAVPSAGRARERPPDAHLLVRVHPQGFAMVAVAISSIAPAFAPVAPAFHASAARSSALTMGVETMEGLGRDGQQGLRPASATMGSDKTLAFFRHAELKHAGVAMA